jgi:magnesium transporter
VDCALYDAGERQGGRVDLETAMARAAACRDGFVWIGLHDPAAGVIEAIGRHFDLHPLAVEDAVHAHQRAKIDVYGDTLLLVLKTARYVDSEELVHIGEINVFVGPRFVVTVRHGRPARCTTSASSSSSGRAPGHRPERRALRRGRPRRRRLRRRDRGLAEDIDQVEEDVFAEEARNPAERIYRLKREIVQFRRAVAPLAMPDGAAGGAPDRHAGRPAHRGLLPRRPRPPRARRRPHRGVRRAALRRAAGQPGRAADARQRRHPPDLAWVAILAVPTMVFGLYGMNFEHMPS